MRICVVTQQFKDVYSGVGLYTKHLIKYLISQGHSLTVIVPETQENKDRLPIRLITVTEPRFLRSQARWIRLSLRFSKAIRKLEAEEEFDIVHFTDARDSYFCKVSSHVVANINDTYSADLRRIGFYRSNYIDWFPRWVYYRFVNFIERRKLPLLDGIIANSHFTHRIIETSYPDIKDRLFMCYKSVDIERYKHIAAKRLTEEISSDNKRILFMGGNMQRKGILTLIKAAPLVKIAIPDVDFVIAGQDKFIQRYKRLCEDLGVLNNFSFLGWVSQDDLLYLYESASVFVMPSITEALGVVFLEAMAAALPVVGTDVGGIPEIISHGQNGMLVPKNEPEKLAQAILLILNYPKLSHVLAINGLHTVEKFSIMRMMECTNKIYSVVC
jgi:glycosyltransferase involved in cell wall biosynthesis